VVALAEDSAAVAAGLAKSQQWHFIDYVWTPSNQVSK
jgi:hypothetical protein